MSVQTFSQGAGCRAGFAIRYFPQTGARRYRGLQCIAPIAPVLKAPLSPWTTNRLRKRRGLVMERGPFNFFGPILSLKRLKLELSNFVYG